MSTPAVISASGADAAEGSGVPLPGLAVVVMLVMLVMLVMAILRLHRMGRYAAVGRRTEQ